MLKYQMRINGLIERGEATFTSLAKEAGVSRETIHNIMGNRHSPLTRTLNKVMAAVERVEKRNKPMREFRARRPRPKKTR